MVLSLFEATDLPKNFWFVRTEGGKFYREFKNNGYIAINWNDFLNLDEICTLSIRKLKDRVKEHYEEEKRPGVAAVQMQTFVGSMKENDIVLIPNTCSREISFGVITSPAYVELSKNIKEGECPYKKRRKVKWLKAVPRNKLDPYLYSLINSHHSITNAYKCRNFINRTLFDFYGTTDETHLIFKVTTEEPIFTSELRILMNTIYEIADIYNRYDKTHNVDMDNVVFRASVNSPGPIEWIGKKQNMLFILILLHFIVGGNISVLGINWETPGIANYILEAYKEYNSSHQKELELARKILNEKLPAPKLDEKVIVQDGDM